MDKMSQFDLDKMRKTIIYLEDNYNSLSNTNTEIDSIKSNIKQLYNECFITIPEKTNTDLTKKKNKEKEKEKEKDITRKYTDQPDLNENNKEILDLNLKNFKSEEVPKIPQEMHQFIK